MNEDDFAAKITRRLDEDTDDLPAATLARLQAAREKAVAQMRTSRPARAVPGGWKLAAPVAAAVVLGAYLLLNRHGTGTDNAMHALEAELLAHELPPQAFHDEGFQQWLKSQSKP